MRLLVHVVTFLLLVAAPSFAAAQPPVFKFETVSLSQTTELITLSVDVYELGGTCPSAGTNPCIKSRIFFRVTPCPEGATCTNGGYELTYDPERSTSPYLTLKLGQEYTFSGQVAKDLSTRGVAACSNIVRCTLTQDIVTTNYTPGTILIPPTWEVSPTAGDDQAVWVSIQLLNPNIVNPCSQQVACDEQQVSATIAPPALTVVGADWGNTTEHTYFSTPPNATVQVKLEVGHSYLLSGGYHFVGLVHEMGGGCNGPVCTYDEVALDKTILATPVATRAITWGAVKSMYRSP